MGPRPKFVLFCVESGGESAQKDTHQTQIFVFNLTPLFLALPARCGIESDGHLLFSLVVGIIFLERLQSVTF